MMADPKQTRDEAFRFVILSLQEREEQVLKFLYKNKGKPFNYKQVGAATNMGHNASSRLGTLRDRGLVTYVGKIYPDDRAGYYVINKAGIRLVDLWKTQ